MQGGFNKKCSHPDKKVSNQNEGANEKSSSTLTNGPIKAVI